MTDFECRLCSATTSLISLFSGKNRRNRDIIRKITSETVQIQFEEGDVHSCICYNCIVQVYNFYVFQVKSQKNEKKLKEAVDLFRKPCTVNHIIVPLETVPLPRIEVLKQTFTPWLQQKLQIIADEHKLNTPLNTANSTNCNSIFQTKGVQIQQESDRTRQGNMQCDFLIERKDKAIQCKLQTAIVEKDHYYGNIKKKYSTTDQYICDKKISNTVKPKINSESFKHKKRKLFISNDSFQKKKIKRLMNAVDIKLQFVNNTSVTSNETLSPCQESKILIDKKGEKQPSNCEFRKNISQLVNRSTQCDLNKLCERNVANVSTQTKIETDEIGSQTDCLSPLFVNGSVQTDLFPIISADIKNILSNAKIEKFSPIPSPTTSLNISTEISCKNDTVLSPAFASPTTKSSTTNLSEITEKVHFVKICRECDFVMYSKAEAKQHRKLHAICKKCKKSFPSTKLMKEHFQLQCDSKLRTMIPKVTIVRLDFATLSSHLEKKRRESITHNNSPRHSEISPLPKKQLM